MVRMSFIEATHIIEGKELDVFRGSEIVPYILVDTDPETGYHRQRYNFHNGYEVVQFAKYIVRYPEAKQEELIKDLNDGSVREWWGQTAAENRRQFFKDRKLPTDKDLK